MDWIKELIAQIIVTAGIIVPAWFALRGKLAELAAGQAATQADAAAARKLSHEVHESMNNRSDDEGNPIPLSDRLDQLATKDDVAAIKSTLAGHGGELAEQRRDILGIREDAKATRREVGQLHGQDRELRNELAEQRRQVADLHSRYGHTRPRD